MSMQNEEPGMTHAQICPFVAAWASMAGRCLSSRGHSKILSYLSLHFASTLAVLPNFIVEGQISQWNWLANVANHPVMTTGSSS